MINLIGSTPLAEMVLRMPRAHLHLYGKSPAAGRKLGHVTIVEQTEKALCAAVAACGLALAPLPIIMKGIDNSGGHTDV